MEVGYPQNGIYGDIANQSNTACFNVNSGDVEDAPALDPIAKFELTEKNGGVYIMGDEQTIKAKRRVAKFGGLRACSSVAEESVIIVGGYAGRSSS